MTDLRTLIPEEEKNLLHDYIKEYLHSDNYCTVDEINHLLRFWAAEKLDLYELLGNNLMVKDHITYQASEDDLMDKFSAMYEEIYNNPELANVKKFIDSYEQITNIFYSWMDATLDKDERAMCCSMIEHCLDTESLVANKNVYMFDWGTKSVTIRRGPHADAVHARGADPRAAGDDRARCRADRPAARSAVGRTEAAALHRPGPGRRAGAGHLR